MTYGSQDRFTLWSPLYAAAAGPLGIEMAAALLTLLSQLAVLTGAWILARTVLPPLPAALGIAVLLAIPGDYGAARSFTYLEGFLTPRMAAEALSLTALAAGLRGRQILALVPLAGAALLHPIMAAAGAVAWAALWLQRSPARVAGPLAAGAAGAALLALLVSALGGRFDEIWLALIERRSPYLFLQSWQLDDWARAAVYMTTLAVGRLALTEPRARALALNALTTSAAGLALTAVAVDGLHLVLVTQLQPWRWQWLGAVAAALLLPQTLGSLWRQGTAGRTVALALTAAWLFGANGLGLAAAAASLAAAAGIGRLRPAEARIVFWGVCGLLTIAVVWRVASNLEFTESFYADPALPRWLRRARSFAYDGSIPVAVLACSCWLARDARRRRIALPAMAAAAAAACAVLMPFTWKEWVHREFPAPSSAALDVLRDRIPVGAEVFAPESPLTAWVLLGRPSYLSVIQTSGLLFSRTTSLELERRAQTLREYVRPETFMAWGTGGTHLNLSAAQLEGVCRTGQFALLATTATLPLVPLAVSAPKPGATALRLYRCAAPPGV